MHPSPTSKRLPTALMHAPELPSIPAIAVEVMQLTQDPQCTLDQLARTIGGDPALSIKLLQLANSSLFNLGQEVTSLQRATMLLGLKTVKLMSLGFSLVDALPRASEGSFDAPAYWRRSICCAVAGRSLARVRRLAHGDEAFLCGLLAYIGQMICARALPEAYARVLLECADRWPDIEDERRVLGYHHADVSAALLESWGLPPLLRVPIAYAPRARELPRETPGELRELTLTLTLADLVTRVLCDARPDEALAALQRLASARFGIDARELDELLLEIESGVDETAALLAVELSAASSTQALLRAARLQIVGLSRERAAS